ncbi:CobW family GTP-binding protein [Spirochaeta dissipatitropha]
MSTVVTIPVVFVSGLLGAGKSTTIASLLDSRKHGSVGVAVQDLADSNIDLGLLQGGETLDAVPQPWIEPVTDSVYKALKKLTDRQHFDAIIVESSGAYPLSTVIADSRIHEIKGLRYAGSITILDAGHMLSIEESDHLTPGICETLCSSDLLLLNKIDRVPIMKRSGMQAHARRLIRDCGSDAPIRATRYGRISLNELLQSMPHIPKINPAQVKASEIPALKHAVFHDRKPFNSEKIYNWLQEITENPPPGLIRAKGFFYIDTLPEYILVFDVVEKHIEIGIEGIWWHSLPEDKRPADPVIEEIISAGGEFGDRKQELVFIGENLDTAAIFSELKTLLTDSFADPVVNDPMHEALRKQLIQLKSKKKRLK